MGSLAQFYGAAKVAAGRIGCTVEHYLEQRARGLAWCSYCRSWQPVVYRNFCRACRAEAWRVQHPPRPRVVRRRVKPANDSPPHPPQSWCRCEWCEKARAA